MSKKMKPILAFLLILIMVFSSLTAAWAAPGDIIHTGLKKIYKNGNETHQNALLQDIRQGADINLFFKEDENGQYYNIVAKEQAALAAVVNLLHANQIPLTSTAIQEYVKSHESEVANAEAAAFAALERSSIDTSEYLEQGTVPKAMLLVSPTHYVTPEAGSGAGSTRLTTGTLPSGATKWRVKIADAAISAPDLDSTLTGFADYTSGSDIQISPDQFVILLATNSSDHIKGYANIPIAAGQIKGPPQPAEALTVGTLEKGSLTAGTIKITGLPDASIIPEASQWRIKVQDMPFTGIPSYNTSLSGTQAYGGEEVILLNETSLHPISPSFTKYMVLLATDQNGAIKGYRYFIITPESVSPAPVQLMINTNYQNPGAGTSDGTTKLTGLHKGISPAPAMAEATQWRVKVQSTPFEVPARDSILSGPLAQTDITSAVIDNIPITPGHSLLLAATDTTGAVKGYRLFNNLSVDQIRGQTAPQLQLTVNYSFPEAGTLSGTTRITTLKFDGISGNPVNWRYKAGTGLTAPILDSVISGVNSYVTGNNISIAGNQDLLLLATDAGGKVKAYQLFTAGTFPIRQPAAVELQQTTHYSLPVKGSAVNTTKIDLLTKGLSPTYPLSEVTQWSYKVQSEPFIAPEMNSTLAGTTGYTAGSDIPAQPNQYLLILATDNDGKIKGYKSFLLNTDQVRAAKVPELLDINYTIPEPGTQSGTTRIATLTLTGLSGVTGWRCKVQQDPFITQDIPELNTTVAGVVSYSAGANIPVSAGQSIMLIAVDGSGRAKAYKFFNNVTASQIKPPDAVQLTQTTHYSLPQPGSATGTTKLSVLSFGNPPIAGAAKWHVKVLSQSPGVLALDSTLEGIDGTTPVYSPGANISAAVGQRLLLLATDAEGKIKAYKEFVLDSSHIQGSPAPLLNTPPLINYENQAGSGPGTTKFINLQFYGLTGATQWRIKVQNTEFAVPTVDSTLTGTSLYTSGADIGVLSNQYLILLATDSSGKIKGYASFSGSELQIKAYAPTLSFTASPGTALDTTQLSGPGLPGGAAKWQILLLGQPFATPAFDEVLTQTPALSDYTLGTDLSAAPGQYLVLLATDSQNKIKGFGMLQLEDYHLKNTSAVLSLPNQGGEEVAESSILLGGITLEITLGDNAAWASDIRTNPTKRNALFDGFQAASEAAQWTKVVQALKADGQGSIFRTDNQKVTIYLPQTSGYDIATEQQITLTVPAIALTGGQRPVTAAGGMVIKPTISAALSGTALQPPLVESDIRSGGKTLVVDLADGNWVGNVATDSTLRNAVFDGLQVVGTENLAQWAKAVTELKNTGALVRTSGTRITITLPPVADYGLNYVKQTIRLVIPKEAVEGAQGDIIAGPTFTVLPDTLQVSAAAAVDSIFMAAPAQKTPRSDQNYWLLTVDRGTLKETITLSDLVISGLPQGITAAATKIGSQQIRITLSGTAASAIANPLTPTVRIKGSAVTEPGSMDSGEIPLKLEPGSSLLEDLKNVKINVVERKLTDTTAQMEYSVNSTTGLNGTWFSCGSPATENVDFAAGKVFVREKLQPGVYWETAALSHSAAPAVAIEFTAEPGKIKLAGATTAMEYSLDGGTVWSTVTEAIANKTQAIDVSSAGSDLRVRVKATINALPSLATAKLNGIHLGSVTFNVAAGKILGTTAEMQYSLNSTNGMDGSWSNCSAPDTNVSFVQGMLFIREKSKVNNVRYLGEIHQDSAPNTTSFEYHVANGTITIPAMDSSVEYRIGTGSWTPLISGTTTGGISFAPGPLEFRYRATNNTLPSPAIQKAVIPAPGSAPAVAVDDVDAVLTKLNPSDNLEYRIGTGSWISWPLGEASVSFPAGVTNVSVRKIATETLLPSQAAAFTFVPKLDLTGTGINVAAGQLTGTTTAMEYSLDSTNGTNGTWVACTSPNTSVNFIEGKVYVREKAKPRNYHFVGEVGRSAAPNTDLLNQISYHVAKGTISIPLALKNMLQYRIGGVWRDLDATTADPDAPAKLMATAIPFQPGKVEFRARATAVMLPSLAVSPSPAVEIPAVPAAPALSFNDVTYAITGLTEQYEYKINNGPWIPGSIISEFSGTDKVSIRKGATATTLAGLEQLISFTPNLNLYTVGINAAASQITNTTTAMEYSLNSTDGINGTWTACTAGNTTVANLSGIVHVREKAKPKNYRRVTEAAIQKRPPLNDTEKTYISYHVAEGTITVNNALVGDLQYRSGTGAWTQLSDGNITPGVQFQQGDLLFRRKANIDELASDPVSIAIIPAPAAAPNLLSNDLANTITGLDASYEYKIGTGIWISGPVDGGFTGNKTVAVRRKAAQLTLPSLEQIITFTDNLDLTSVGLNIASNQITGTTAGMEYSLNSSDGINGTWTTCSNTNTNVTFIPGKVFIREKAYPSNNRQVAVIGMPAAGPSIGAGFEYDAAFGTITVPDDLKNRLQYRFGDGSWTNLGTERTTAGIAFVPGKLYLRYKADAVTLPSLSTEWITILAPASAPSLAFNDVTNKIAWIAPSEYEYKIGTGPWTPAEVPGDFSGTKTVQVRRRATQTTLPSLIQTINFTANLDLSPLWVDTSLRKINGTTTAMEYSINSTNGTDGDWVACGNTATNLPEAYINQAVYVRAKTQPANFRLVHPVTP